jgi:ppGpp synthetase/RelA/SpoT-type nucleotidyltranferase/tetratricopeptide (TPR) repeat protein
MLTRTAADTAIELATTNALRGAENLRDRLLLEMSLGSPAVSDLAYAVKVRVKEDYKIHEKVLAKRRDRPLYGVPDLRDILGLRIITLYRLDALSIIPLLLKMIQSAKDEGSLFRPGSLEEIVIYSTNPQGDAQGLPTRLMALFKERGLDKIARIHETPQNYTSIHMVAWGRGKYHEGYRDIPVEIQVRTAFEDVWGEIDHALKYKRDRASISDRAPASSSPERLQSSLAHLNVLKTMIDGIAQYADQIKLQITEIDSDRLRSAVSKTAEDPLVRLAPLKDLPAELKEAIQDAVGLVKPALEAGPKADEGEKIRTLREGLSRLDVVREKLAQQTGLSIKTKKEADYVVSMQRALVLFEIGNMIENGATQLTQAAKIYATMESTFPRRLVVKYRYGKVLDALGARDAAIDKFRIIVEQLSQKGEPTPKDHWIRASAPRVLGVLLWEEADTLRRQDLVVGQLQFAPRRVALLREAFEITQRAYAADVKEEEVNEKVLSQRSKAANNLLYYALEMIDAALDCDEPAEDCISHAQMRAYLHDMGADDPGGLDDMRFLDTARRAYLVLGDLPPAQAAAQRFLDLAHSRTAAHDIERVHTDEMVDAARMTVTLRAG